MSNDPPPERADLRHEAARYRALILDQGGRVLTMTAISAESDDIAIEAAKSMVDGHAVELWDGVRFIENFAPAE
ncbi:hypothetical protein [Methylobacterium iners]|uniref:BON domain-containing protein n=1 Tax=Methylobacterium iners TaxID=418707 RepID=A0ABQ4S024_9HYPH|nr:hypothetical protein [Methylobacterium iners]GJD95782.1 hypothetical protein OCOJLMKI_2996 [Methylobacterium iners]